MKIFIEENPLTYREFVNGFDFFKQEGKEDNGRKRNENAIKRARLVADIPLDDPERVEKLEYAYNKTRNPIILSATIEKIDYRNPEEAIYFLNALAQKSSNSKEKREGLEKIWFELLKEIVESSENFCDYANNSQKTSALGIFKEFYKKILKSKVYSEKESEEKRKFIIQSYLPLITNVEFKIKAFSFIFTLENSTLMLLRIKKIVERENINLNLPRICLNQDIIFTAAEIRMVEKEMETLNAAREEQVVRI